MERTHGQRRSRGEISVLSVNSSVTISHLFVEPVPPTRYLGVARPQGPGPIKTQQEFGYVINSNLTGNRAYRISNTSSGELVLISGCWTC